MPIARPLWSREHGRWWESLSSPMLACARPRPGVFGTRTDRHRPANRSMASTCVSAATGRLRYHRGGAQIVEGASARGALGSCMRRRRNAALMARRRSKTGEEHDLRSLKKMLLGAVTAMVLAAGVAVTPASATVPSWGNEGVNENTNVPYLAWRGEHVRLGFCVSPALAELAGVNASNLDAGGAPRSGAVIRSTARFRFRSSCRAPRSSTATATTPRSPRRRPASLSSS